MSRGRLVDVLIQDEFFFPDDIIRRRLADFVTVYADPGLKELIAEVEGVRDCYPFLDSITYHVYLDPRYDREWVKAEIEAAVRCAE